MASSITQAPVTKLACGGTVVDSQSRDGGEYSTRRRFWSTQLWLIRCLHIWFTSHPHASSAQRGLVCMACGLPNLPTPHANPPTGSEHEATDKHQNNFSTLAGAALCGTAAVFLCREYRVLQNGCRDRCFKSRLNSLNLLLTTLIAQSIQRFKGESCVKCRLRQPACKTLCVKVVSNPPCQHDHADQPSW